MKKIKLINRLDGNKIVDLLLDDVVYGFLNGRRFSFYGRQPKFYLRVLIQGHWIPIHKLLISNDFALVDHINGNQFDNQCHNLRISDPSLNRINTRKAFRKGTIPTSKYKGVRKRSKVTNKACKQWTAAFKFKGVRYHLGSFKTEKEAALAYDKKVREIVGEYATLNFK